MQNKMYLSNFSLSQPMDDLLLQALATTYDEVGTLRAIEPSVRIVRRYLQ